MLPVCCLSASETAVCEGELREPGHVPTPPRPQTGLARGRLFPRSRPHLFCILENPGIIGLLTHAAVQRDRTVRKHVVDESLSVLLTPLSQIIPRRAFARDQCAPSPPPRVEQPRRAEWFWREPLIGDLTGHPRVGRREEFRADPRTHGLGARSQAVENVRRGRPAEGEQLGSNVL